MNNMLNNNRKTILLLTTEFHDQLIGGLGRHINDLVRTGKHKMTFIVMTISHTGNESYSVEEGIHIFRLLPWKDESVDISDYFRNLNFRFIQFILQDLHLRFDIVHVHDWFFAITGCQIKKLLKKPLVSTFHSTESERKQFNNGNAIPQILEYEDQLLQLSDHIIVCSDYMKNILIERWPSRNKSISIIPNGIIVDDFSKFLCQDDALRRFPFIKKPFLLGMGRLVKEKGFHVLIEAFSKLQDKHPTLKLVLAGIGPYENQLKQMVELNGLESKVIFVGFLKEMERNTLLTMCEMLVVPSLYEPFGIVALEGMVSAKPVLAFKTGGLKEILQYPDRMIVDQVSSSGLGDKLHYCLQHPIEMEKIADQGYQAVIDNYQWFSIIKKTIAVYNQMVCK